MDWNGQGENMSKYAEWLEGDNLILLQGWARDGLTDEQIAHNMGIAYSTLRDWKKKFPAFGSVLKKTKEVVDLEVESALYKSAMGYDYTEEVWERRFIKERGEYDMVLTKRMLKHADPNPTSLIYWLKNRKRAEWRDKQEFVDNTSLEKLDQILEETRNNAETESETE